MSPAILEMCGVRHTHAKIFVISQKFRLNWVSCSFIHCIWKEKMILWLDPEGMCWVDGASWEGDKAGLGDRHFREKGHSDQNVRECCVLKEQWAGQWA